MTTRRLVSVSSAALALAGIAMASLALAWPAVGGLVRPPRPSQLSAPGVRAGHEPLGPVKVLLQADPGAARDAPVTASLQPLRELAELTWRWELSPGVVLLQGAPSGEGDPRAGALTEIAAVLQPPHLPAASSATGDATGGAASSAASSAASDAARSATATATLVVRAVFEGADDQGPTGEETTLQHVELRWGEGPAVPVPLVRSTDPETGELVPMAAVPSTHRTGR
jgi:hypothetical protein